MARSETVPARSDIRLWIETVLSGASIVLAVMTLFWREWIEFLFGFDPDHGNGSVEWLFVLALAVIGISLGVIARRDWRIRQMTSAKQA